MARFSTVFLCVLLICGAAIAKSIMSETTTMAVATELLLRNVLEGVAGNCPDGMVPGILI